jgi:translocation and assembly module TamB
MSKAASIAKSILKTILWIVSSFILIIIIAGLLLRMPAAGSRIADFAASFISNKTGTKVEIERINISFSGSAVVEGVFLEDLNNDTLIYAGLTKVNLSLKDLVRKKLHLNSVALENADIQISNTESDSLFSYEFPPGSIYGSFESDQVRT